MHIELRTRNRGPALLLTITRLLSTTSVTVPDHQRGAPELLDLALEPPHLAFVPDLLGLDVPLVRLDLAYLFAELQVPGLHRIDAFEEVSAHLLRSLGFLRLPGAFCHFYLNYLYREKWL